LYDVDKRLVRFAAVHIMSNISDEEKNMLTDVLGEMLENVEVRTGFTHKDVLGKTVAELILFGKNPERA